MLQRRYTDQLWFKYIKRKRVEVYFRSVYPIKMARGSDQSAKWNIEIVNYKDAIVVPKLKRNWMETEVEFASNVVMLSDLIF